MKDIPFEILANVLQNLSEADLPIARYSTVSRFWQSVVEHSTFRSLMIQSSELDYLHALLQGYGVHRGTILTSITVKFILPPMKQHACCRVKSLPSYIDITASLALSVRKVFRLLHYISKVSRSTQPTLSLKFEGMEWESWFPWEDDAACEDHSLEDTDSAGRKLGMNILGAESLEPVFNVKYFSATDNCVDWGAGWISDVLNRLKTVSTVQLSPYDSYTSGRIRRKALREDFGDMITKIARLPLTEIQICVRGTKPMGNHHAPVHRFIRPDQVGEDVYTRVLGHLSEYPFLTVFHLKGCPAISPHIFRFLNGRDGPLFPALRDFFMDFILETADGKWFFNCDEDILPWEHDFKLEWDGNGWDLYGDGPSSVLQTKWCECRMIPNPLVFTPFILSAAETASQMKNLKKFTIIIPLDEIDFDVPQYFQFWLLQAGIPHKEDFLSIPADKSVRHLPRLYWRTTNWKPNEQELTAWKSVMGPDSVAYHLSEADMKDAPVPQKRTNYFGIADWYPTIYEGILEPL